MRAARASPAHRRISGTTLLLALSAVLALSSVAVAGTTGGGLYHVLRHEETHRALRQKGVAAAAVRASNDDDAASLPPASPPASTTPSPPASTTQCIPDGKPNPISHLWPSDVSGNLNGTTLIVPIPLAQARQAIPSEYGLLEHQWREWLPGFPMGMYPMMAVAVYDHDLRFPAYSMSPPSFSRAALEFPFVDALNDGHSAFRWAANMLLTAGSPAVEGTEAFGVNVYPAAFDPPCHAYRAGRSGSDGDRHEPGLATFRAWSNAESGSPGNNNNTSSTTALPSSAAATTLAKAGRKSCGGSGPGHGETPGDSHDEPWKSASRSLYFETRPALLAEEAGAFPYPFQFLVNITNQPVFAEPSICDNYKRLFNTTLTTDPANAPVQVVGSVRGNLEPFGPWGIGAAAAYPSPPSSAGTGNSGNNIAGGEVVIPHVWSGVYGWRLATAFLEPPVPDTCAQLKGYMGTGPGDSAMP
ncbi:uncharacterized protein B0I36DRAFT_321756 [Microdochium trichocladiopsis]|uniref:Uncharacterized protein n=1 Tax=Microdochium trichocladiopsis TaxID=1682393 RepID=A0A9P9BS92_9PEZI|nr:uncharacterized protein B0I36DRAFT_321756 [Microdochium trichocladiopsis]KAH7033610.1 hypothetical protein B0I36DRAFT_321756 [Microdochium trichocladiopsis]